MEETAVNAQERLVIIGGSAGSLQIILQIIPYLKRNLTFAIAIVVHRKNTEDTILEDLIAAKCSIPLHYVDDKTVIEMGCIYVAPSGYHMLFEKDYTIALDGSEKIFYSRPSIDVSFESATHVYQNNLVAILLSGANADGTVGLLKVKAKKGITIVQDPTTAEIPFMPSNAVKNSSPDFVFSDEEIIDFLNNW